MSAQRRAGGEQNGPVARLARLPALARAVLALSLGALATLALPPDNIVPALMVGATGLVWLIGACRRARAAFLAGWLFGAGFFAASLSWLANAFYVEAETFGAVAVPAIAGLAVGLGLFPALAALAAWRAPAGWRRALAFALAWTVLEWLRGHILTGFPWNLVATVWSPWPAPEQAAALVGAYGLGFATMLIAALPAAGWRGLAAAAALLGALWVGGMLRLPDGPSAVRAEATLRIVQGNIAQHHKWRGELRAAHLERYVAFSRAPGPPPKLLIWPETATPYFIDEEADIRAVLAGLVAPGGAIVTGTIRRDMAGADGPRLFNSIQAIDDQGRIAATYDKAHLVPFGEFMPLRDVIPFGKLTPGAVDFSAGPGALTWHLPGVPPLSPLVCYEAMFPGRVVDAADPPAWMLNVTNDAWFGDSDGPRQHFAAVRLRAIEQGLPLVRAANTGISAIVDPYGRVVTSLDLGQSGVLDGRLPAPIAPPLYASVGDLALIPLLIVFTVIISIRRISNIEG